MNNTSLHKYFLHRQGLAVSQPKGFTLIELLIVIALLGALAIGLLATIDPFEQLKKGRDTATRNTVTELYNAELRYYGTRGTFQWATGTTFTASTLNGAAWGPYIASLTFAGELKANFTTVAGDTRMSRIYVTSTAADDLGICFVPESKNFRLDPNTKYDSSGIEQASGACVATGGTTGSATTCSWCIR